MLYMFDTKYITNILYKAQVCTIDIYCDDKVLAYNKVHKNDDLINSKHILFESLIVVSSPPLYSQSRNHEMSL